MKKASAENLKKILESVLYPFRAVGQTRYTGISDAEYTLPALDEIQDMQLEDGVQKIHLMRDTIGPLYKTKDFIDCDDFTLAYKSHITLSSRIRLIKENNTSPLCVGIGWGKFKWAGKGKIYHAVNWTLLEDGRFMWIEPQLAPTPGKKHPNNFFPLEECLGDVTFILV